MSRELIDRARNHISFTSEMFRALYDGRKTQTRRTSRLSAINAAPDDFTLKSFTTSGDKAVATFVSGGIPIRVQFKYRLGEMLYVKEPHRCTEDGEVIYRADKDDPNAKWTVPFLMPRSVSRMAVLVVTMRVCRVQSISQYDAMQEGVDGPDHKANFAALWDTIHGGTVERWERNPWVLALTLHVAEKV